MRIHSTLGATVLMLFLATGLAAQSSANASAAVSLRVFSDLTLTKNTDLDMGITNPGINQVVAATAGSAGKFTMGGQGSAGVTVTYPASITLTSGANTLSFAPDVNGLDTDTQGSSSSVSSGSSVTTSAGGAYYFWLGGTATVPGAQATGTYTGSLTLSVAY